MPTADRFAPLRAALAKHDAEELAPDVYAAIQAAVRAVLAGRQQKKNLDPEMAKAIKAACRAFRRRAR